MSHASGRAGEARRLRGAVRVLHGWTSTFFHVKDARTGDDVRIQSGLAS
jgi:hypothetical protein